MIKFPGWWQRNEEGPPDLDEVMRDLSRKINALFGKTGGSQGGREPVAPNAGNVNLPVLPIAALVALIWLGMQRKQADAKPL